MRDLVPLVARYLMVMTAAAGALALADRLPAALTGATHGARVYRTVEDAERAIGTRLRLPAYYPDSLDWPPSRIEVAPGPPAVAAVRIHARRTAREALVVCQSIGGPAAPPPWLLAPAERLREAEAKVDGRPARLARLLTGDGRVVHDLWWTGADRRRFTLRYAGPVNELWRIAASLERTHP